MNFSLLCLLWGEASYYIKLISIMLICDLRTFRLQINLTVSLESIMIM